MRILLIGGSGFVSGTIARKAIEAGHSVWVVTRGKRTLPNGVVALPADRNEEGALAAALADGPVTWDLAIDCIGYKPAHAEQDIALLRDRVGRLVFISTDFVFDPSRAMLPRTEEMPFTTQPGYGYDKRQCERVLIDAKAAGRCGSMTWTILRPCHIYGPGSLLGCLPAHGRDVDLPARIQRGESLRLVGGGYFLQQPILAADLAATALACPALPATAGEIFITAGPDVIESRRYYQIIADELGVELRIEELPVDAYLAEHPESRPFLAHRIYDMSKLRLSGLPVPATPIEQGLREHVRSLLTTD